MKLLTIISLLFSVIFMSCDSKIYYGKRINNYSSHDIWLYNTTPIPPCTNTAPFDSILLASGSHITLGLDTYRGKSVDDFQNCDIAICTDTLHTKIVPHDSLQLSFIINRNSNWEYKILQREGIMVGECECHLTITDADIN